LSFRRGVAWSGVLLLFVPPVCAQQGGERAPAWAHVTYLTLSSAYIDAGTAEGLAEGTRLTVLRGDSTVAVLRARFVAVHKAACEIVSATAPLAVGDSARFVPVGPPRDSTAVVAMSAWWAPVWVAAASGLRPTSGPGA
jgi:hypothetical protein